MTPGGVTCALDEAKLQECVAAIDGYQAWYERDVLGCTSEEWLALESADDFDEWLERLVCTVHVASSRGATRRFTFA